MGKSRDISQSILYPKWFGGSASCMAVLVSHPLDLLKVRMQMEQSGVKAGTLNTCIRIVQGEGVLTLYNGVGLIKNNLGRFHETVLVRLTIPSLPSIQAILTHSAVTYGSVRIGLYETLKEQTKANNIPTSPPVLGLLAGISGFTGAIFGNPSDIGNIRMQNGGSLPAHLRCNYRHIFDAWRKIKRQEGWKAFGQGLWPNAFRCGMMTSCQLASYDSFRGLIVATTGIHGDHPGLHLSASFLAALVATTLCSPIDVIKTQLMGSSTKQGILHVMKDLTTTEGMRWVFRGWMPGFVRLGPQTMATLILLEQHKRLYRDLKGKTGTQKIAL